MTTTQLDKTVLAQSARTLYRFGKVLLARILYLQAEIIVAAVTSKKAAATAQIHGVIFQSGEITNYGCPHQFETAMDKMIMKDEPPDSFFFSAKFTPLFHLRDTQVSRAIVNTKDFMRYMDVAPDDYLYELCDKFIRMNELYQNALKLLFLYCANLYCCSWAQKVS